MEFNPCKCKIVTISHKKNPPQRKYVLCGVELEQVNSFSFPYLRVRISNELKWSAHVSMTAAKANKWLGTRQRNLWNCPKNVKKIACTSLVQPKLEYAVFKDQFLKKVSVLWKGFNVKQHGSAHRIILLICLCYGHDQRRRVGHAGNQMKAV